MMPAEAAYKTSAADLDDRNALVMQELSQVYYIASRLRERLPPHVELEDLVNAGVIGLLEADWGSRSIRRRGREISDAKTRLAAKLGRTPAESEIAEEMHLDTDHLRKILAHIDGLHLVGQQMAVANDSSDMMDLIESAPDLDDPDPFDLCLEGEVKAHLAEAVAQLSEREQLILSLYYREELTMKEIAAVVGVALSRVSQIRQATMKKLRVLLAHLNERPNPARESSGATYEHA